MFANECPDCGGKTIFAMLDGKPGRGCVEPKGKSWGCGWAAPTETPEPPRTTPERVGKAQDKQTGTSSGTVYMTLPYPPPLNNLYFNLPKGGRGLTTRGKEYKKTVALIAIVEKVRPIEGPLKVEIDVYRPQKRGDTDAYAKAPLDALTGIAWQDDEQICELTIRRWDTDRKNPRLEVAIEPVRGRESG